MSDDTTYAKATQSEFVVYWREPPKKPGYYQIGGPGSAEIWLIKRPRWLTRLFMRWLVEWVWVDAK